MNYNYLKKGIPIFFLLAFLTNFSFAQDQFANLKFESFKKIESITIVIYQDSKGFIWSGGYTGLLRYDGYTLKRYGNEPSDSLSISDSKINSIVEDENGFLWIGTQHGLNRFDPKRERFNRFFINDMDSTSQQDEYVYFPFIINGKLWGHTSIKRLYYFDLATKKFIHPSFPTIDSTANKMINSVRDLYKDQSNNLWIFSDAGTARVKYGTVQPIVFNKTITETNKKDVIQFDHFIEKANGNIWLSTNGQFYQFDEANFSINPIMDNNDLSKMPENIFFPKYLDNSGVFWSGGILGASRFDTKNNTFTQCKNDALDNNSIGNNRVNCIFEDHSQSIWFGLLKGINKLIPLKNQVINIKTDVQTSGILTRESFEIEPGKLLIWMDHRLTILHWKTGKKEAFPFLPKQNLDAWQKGMTNFYKDENGLLWMGSMSGGAVFTFDFKTRQFQYYDFDKMFNESGLNKVNDIYEDSKGRMWICHWNAGISIREAHQKNFKHYYLNANNFTEEKNRTRIVFEDSANRIWISTRGGLAKFNENNKTFTFYENDRNDLNSISNNTVFAFCEDAQANLWLTTYGGGLNKFNPKTEKFTYYTIKDGLADNSCISVLPDAHGNLWIGTLNGMSKFNLANESFTNYDVNDGFLNTRFDAFSYSASPYSGHFFLEGEKGLDIFHPDSIQQNLIPPKMLITRLKINNKDVGIKKEAEKIDEEEYYLQQDISETSEITLAYQHKVITFEFAALHFAAPAKNQYKYQLEGFDKNWQNIGLKRTATFTNLDAGDYIFKVKGANSSGIWSTDYASITIHILPPWWRSWWAYLFYGLILTSLLLAIIRFQKKRFALNTQLQYEQKEALRLKELDRLKTNLYNNITHEFRTPLTVILGLSDVIKDQLPHLKEEQIKTHLHAIDRNGKGLLSLVNQMLDLSKIEAGKLKLNLVQGDMIAFAKYLLESYHSFAESKNITLHFQSDLEQLLMDYDPERFQQVFNNLMSNAIKFTPKGGTVAINMATETKANGSSLTNEYLLLEVKDTGIGIEQKQLAYIFDRFYQIEGGHTRKGEGTGIGLALTKQLVQLMQGDIRVESQVNIGSSFIVKLAIHRSATIAPALPTSSPITNIALPIKKDNNNIAGAEQPIVLIVEDNDDVRQYIRSCLENQYQIVEAENGQIGIDKAQQLIPELIISDVMMPEKDGFELCATLKQDELTSHIPIIMLTAKADMDSKLEGLEYGADAYLVKPFHKRELNIRIEKLIALRKKLQARYQNIALPQLAVNKQLKIEDAFVLKVKKTIEEHMDDVNFGPTELAKTIFLSKTQVHRKLKALMNKSTGQYIHFVRLHKAKEFLESGEMTVTQVAMEVGYKELSYFSKLFSELFGVSPSAILKS